MLLNLKTIASNAPYAEDVQEFSHELDLSAVRLWGERPFSRPVSVSGCITRRSEVYAIRYAADFEIRMKCSRCLAPVTQTYHREFSHTILEREQDEDLAGEFVTAPNGELDLDELVTADLLFELSGVPLCDESCRGLCPKCGKNLNEGGCGCDLSEPDSRFDVLRKLLEE